MPSVSRLSIAPVKGLGLQHPDEVLLEPHGVTENRRFYMVDDSGRRYGLLREGTLVQVAVEYDPAGEQLALRFPDGTVAEGQVELDGEVTTEFYGRSVEGRLVKGPWADALSAFAGTPLCLVQSVRLGDAVDRRHGGVSLVGDSSVDALGRHSGTDVDARRFRMMIGLAGSEPHEEEGWIGREISVGEARVRLQGAVGRCAITTQNPQTGQRDFDTLGAIKQLRGQNPETGELDLGVYGEVVQPGRVRVGDGVEPLAR